ncbi:MAG: acetylxylan esterase [bacterium]|nr:acetylxylan esterase [bacterium]
MTLLLAGACLIAMNVHSQEEANYDESKVPSFTLPDPLFCQDGTKVDNAGIWTNKRRPEIYALFASQVYGKTPDKKVELTFEVFDEGEALGGKAIRRQVAFYPKAEPHQPRMELLIYIPKAASGPVPAFVMPNFQGNHTINADPGIHISSNWMTEFRKDDKNKDTDPESTRGKASSRWSVDRILDAGFALATIWYYDIDPDYDDGFQNGIHPLFYDAGQNEPRPDQWGSIGAWAWGLSRALDYLESDQDIDGSRVAVMGHSRLGKTALWAGASDERFAMVISNDSGCGGAALSRRRFGETVNRINHAFPHWFCDNFNRYNNNEDALPVDQHMLIALCAPRPVYVASAQDDRWADPRGEFLSAKYASPVYRLLTGQGLNASEMPDVNQPVQGRVSYHIRTGKHDVTDYDWEQYINVASRFLK